MGKEGSLEDCDQRNVITRKEIYLKEIKCLPCLRMSQNTFFHLSQLLNNIIKIVIIRKYCKSKPFALVDIFSLSKPHSLHIR